MRIKAIVEYDGTTFSGWQVQPDVNTVQAELENALAKILQTTTPVICAGRTDAGVHGRGQVVHFDCDTKLSLNKITFGLNSILPPSVAVHSLKEVSQEFHARFSATQREYRYFISTKKTALLKNRVAQVYYVVDWLLVENELKSILGLHKFSSFCSVGYYSQNHNCNITKAQLIKKEDDIYEIVIAADRFVYKMIRTLVGTLLDIGRGLIKKSLLEIIEAEDRSVAGATAPACGLYFEKVDYPADLELKVGADR
jgi:tRNA pseudouridine38-40 synthase